MQNPINVDKDSSFYFIFSRELTKKFEPGQYFIVLQHPMQNGRPDIITNSPGTDSRFIWKDSTKVGEGINTIDISHMRHSDAAEKLIDLLNLPDVDDSYTKLVFMVEEPVIKVDPIQPKNFGEFFTITGLTNLNVDDELLIEFIPEFPLIGIGQENEPLQVYSGICKIIRGDTFNRWSFDVDGNRLVKGRFLIQVTSLETDLIVGEILEVKGN
jgi:hypothetical protein